MSEIQERWGVNPKVILHCGAHELEEADWYAAAGVERVLWVEGNADIVPKARSIAVARTDGVDHRVAHALLGSEPGREVTFNITNNGQSSSVLDLDYHLIAHPEVRVSGQQAGTIRTLDDVCEQYGFTYSDNEGSVMCAIDCQGYELEILRGAEQTLKSVEWLYLEVNLLSIYRSCVLLSELDPWLCAQGFECMELRTAGCRYADCSDGGSPRHVGWGDGIFCRTEDPTPLSVKWPHDWQMWFPEDAL